MREGYDTERKNSTPFSFGKVRQVGVRVKREKDRKRKKGRKGKETRKKRRKEGRNLKNERIKELSVNDTRPGL